MLRLERMRVQEALNARDVAVSRLEEACASVREKTVALDALRDEKAQLQQKLALMKENVPDNSRREVAELGVNTNSLSPFRKSTTGLKPIEEQFASMTMSDRGGVWNEEADSDIEVRSGYMRFRLSSETFRCYRSSSRVSIRLPAGW